MKLVFDLEPVPKGRPRFTRSGATYTPKRTRDYEKMVGWLYRANGGRKHLGGVFVSVEFYVRRCADADNLLKAFLDGLNGVAWVDDRQVIKFAGSVIGGMDLSPGSPPRIEAEIACWPSKRWGPCPLAGTQGRRITDPDGR